jgi:hypothetical protein
MSEGVTSCSKYADDRFSFDVARTVWNHRCVLCSGPFRPGMNITRTEVLLICPTTHRSSISHHIHSDTSSSSYPSLHVDVQTYDESSDEPVGTCAVLKRFSSRIQRDFIVLPCDIIPPEDLSLSSLLNKFRVESNLDGAIVTSCWLKAQGADKGVVPEEWGRGGPSVSIIWDKKSGTLLHIDTADDCDRNSDELEVRMSLLSRFVSLRGRDDELTPVLKIPCCVFIVPVYGFSCIRLQAIRS